VFAPNTESQTSLLDVKSTLCRSGAYSSYSFKQFLKTIFHSFTAWCYASAVCI